MSDRIIDEKKAGVVLILVPLILMLFVIPMLFTISSIKAISTHMLEEDVEKTPNEWEKLTDTLLPDAGYAHVFNESIYFIGKSAVQVYDPLTDSWEIIKSTGLSGDHTSGGSAILDDCIYFFYGLLNAFIYNISDNNFVEIERSTHTRTDIAVAELNGLIYVSGGWIATDPTSLTLVEVYNPGTKIWSEVASMNVGRKRHEMVALDGYLYTIGGEIEDSFFETTKSTERFNPTTNSWELVKLPTYSYSNFGIVATDDHNFVVTHFSTEVYSASSEKWLRGPDLYPTYRDILHPTLTYYNGCVYAIGGQQWIEGDDFLSTIHRWDIRTHKFISYSDLPTFSEFLQIWPRVLPTVLFIEGVMILCSIIVSLLSGLFVKFPRTKRLQKYLSVNSWPVNVQSFKGYQKHAGILIVGTAILPALFMPLISFLPIMLYDASIRLVDLYLMGLIPSYLLMTFGLGRLHKKLEKPHYYPRSDLLVIQSFGNDLIIPITAIKMLQKDPDRLWARIQVKLRLFPASWTSKFFAFDSKEDFMNFMEEINNIVSLPWEVASFSSIMRRILVIPHKNIQRIEKSSLKEQLNRKTVQILDSAPITPKISPKDPISKQVVKYCTNCGQPAFAGTYCIYCGTKYPDIPFTENDQQSSK